MCQTTGSSASVGSGMLTNLSPVGGSPSSPPSTLPTSSSNRCVDTSVGSAGLKRMRAGLPDIAILVRGSSSSSSISSVSSSSATKRVRFSQCERVPVDLTHIVIGALVLALVMCAREWYAILSEDHDNDIFKHRLATRNLSLRFWGCFRPVCAGVFALILLWVVSCGWQSLSAVQKRRRK